MSGTISGADLKVAFNGTLMLALDARTALDTIVFDWTVSLANGTGANQASQIYYDSSTLAASGTEDIDLAASLINTFGTTITFTKIKLLAFKAAAANTNNVNIQRATANGFVTFLAALDGLALRPGGIFVLSAPDANGMAVTAATADKLTITNSAGSTSVTYEVLIVGVD